MIPLPRRARTLAGAVLLAVLLAGCASKQSTENVPPPQSTLPPVKQQEVSPQDRAQLHAQLGAGYFEREVDDAVAALSRLLEPIIIVVLGVVIGGLVVAMYLPIFKLGAVV